jgi:hypothetical protein
MSGALVQTLIVGLIVLAALAYVGRRAWRTVLAGRATKDGDGCGSGGDCGCGH